MKTTTFCTKHGACSAGRAWAKEAGADTMDKVWERLESPAWMVWCLRQHGEFDRAVLTRWALDCAEDVLPLFEKKYPKDKAPRICIQTARDFAAGKVPRETLDAARRACRKSHAYAAAYAYAAAAYADAAAAAYAADAAAYAAYAYATYADAADAADAAYAADAYARAAARKRYCDRLRELHVNPWAKVPAKV